MMPRPISVKAVGKPSMMATTMSPSIRSPRTSLFTTLPRDPLPCRFLNLLGVLHRQPACLLVDVLAHLQLLLHHVDLRHVLQTAGPLPRPQADDAPHDLGQTLEHDEGTGDRDHGLQRIDRG